VFWNVLEKAASKRLVAKFRRCSLQLGMGSSQDIGGARVIVALEHLLAPQANECRCFGTLYSAVGHQVRQKALDYAQGAG
jgi:hypothetical protein